LSSENDDTIDRAGSFSGTPAYMAPEILLQKPADGRADIFSLGIVFYESLTGRHPFRADSFSVTSDRIRGEKPAPAHSFNPDVSPALESLLQRMLAKKPADRYATAQELLADLDHLQSGLTPARLQRLLPQQQKRASVRKGFLLGAAAVLCVVLASWGVYVWMHRPPVLKERGWALISDFDSTGEDPIPDQSIREGLEITLGQSRYVNVFPRTRMFEALQRMKRPDVTHVDENLGREICLRENLQVLLTGSIQHFGNAFQITVRGLDPVHGTLLFAEQEHFNHKEEMFDRVDTISRKVRKDLGEATPVIKNTSKPLANVTTGSIAALQLYSQAKDLIDQGNPERAEPLLNIAVEKDSKFAMAHMLLAGAYGTGVGKNRDALFEIQKAYDLRSDVNDRERRRIEASYFNLHDQFDEEVEALKLLVKDYPDDADAHHELAESYYNSGSVENGIVELREFLRLNPLSLEALGQMMIYLVVANRGQEAVEVYEQAHRQGLESPGLRWGLGLAYFWLDRIEDAQREFHQLETEGGLSRALGMHYLAKIEVYQGKFAAGLQALDASIANDNKLHRKGYELKAHFFKGRIFLLLNQKSLAIREAKLILAAPPDDVQAIDLRNAGILLADAGAMLGASRVLRRLESVNTHTPSKWNESCLYSLQGEMALAQKQVTAAIAAFKAGKAQYPQASARIGQARAYEDMGDWLSATTAWREALDLRGEILRGESPTEIAMAQLQIARAYRHLGDEISAQAHYKQFLLAWKNTDQVLLRGQVEREMRARGLDNTNTIRRNAS
jgi:tetratricopeptide (TPR) repeat protein